MNQVTHFKKITTKQLSAMLAFQETKEMGLSMEGTTAAVYLTPVKEAGNVMGDGISREDFRFITVLDPVRTGNTYTVPVQICLVVWDEDGKIYRLPWNHHAQFMRIVNPLALPQSADYVGKTQQIVELLLKLDCDRPPVDIMWGSEKIPVLTRHTLWDKDVLFREVFPRLANLSWEQPGEEPPLNAEGMEVLSTLAEARTIAQSLI